MRILQKRYYIQFIFTYRTLFIFRRNEPNIIIIITKHNNNNNNNN